MAVDFGEYKPGRDDTDIIRLRDAVWGSDHPHNNPAYFSWLFQSNPAGWGSGVILRRNEQIIGFVGLAARRMQMSGDVVPVAQALDYMVDPAIGGGLSGMYGYRLLDQWRHAAIAAGYRFGIGFPNANSSRLATSPKLGWLPVFSPVLLVRPLARLSLSKASVRGIPPAFVAAGLNLLAGWSRVAQTFASKPTRGHPVPIVTFGSAFDELCSEFETPGSIGTRRDSAYLNWRYVDHPLNRYDCIGWDCSGQIRGYLASSVRTLFGLKATLIVDLAAADRTPEIEFALLAEAQQQARAAGSSLLVTLAVPNSLRHHHLTRFGFHAVPRRFEPKSFLLVVHQLGGALDALTEASAWQFAWADMDVV